MKDKNFGRVFDRVGGDWSVCSNYSKHKNGRIWVIWLSQIFEVMVVKVEMQLVHCRVVHKATGFQFEVTFVYGLNEAMQRGELWDQLRMLAGIVQGPWLIGGDFNNVLNLNDRVGSTITLAEGDPFR